jgi:hypothetical protein
MFKGEGVLKLKLYSVKNQCEDTALPFLYTGCFRKSFIMVFQILLCGECY